MRNAGPGSMPSSMARPRAWIAGVADIQQQLLDMRLGGAEADARFAGIDAIRATAATIGTAIDAAPGGDLTAFDPTDAAHWEAP